MLTHDPPHPDSPVGRQCLEPLGPTVTEAANIVEDEPIEPARYG